MLTRKLLASKGLEAEAIEEIIQAHTETVNALKDKMDDFEKIKAENERLKDVEAENESLRQEVAKNSDKDYDKLKAEFDAYKQDIENKETRAKKEQAYKEILKDANIPERHFAKILKYSDVDSVEFDEEGKVKGADKILESVKEEWSDHIETTQKKGTTTPKPPKNSAGGKSLTKDEIMKITDTKERKAKLKEYLLEEGEK